MNTSTKRLYRSNNNRMIAGICGGFGSYFNIDPSIVRLIAVVGFFVTASVFFWAYLILWIVIPEETTIL
jgi:phage shock protein PspC (stress-responsive transcriptional regulator)